MTAARYSASSARTLEECFFCQLFEKGGGVLRILTIVGTSGHFLEGDGRAEKSCGTIIPGRIVVVKFLKVICKLEPGMTVFCTFGIVAETFQIHFGFSVAFRLSCGGRARRHGRQHDKAGRYKQDKGNILFFHGKAPAEDPFL